MNATACYFVSAMADENTEIARGLRRRDPDLLDHLIEKYQHRLLRYLLYLTGRREIAEDFFQETWIRVLERGHQYDGKTLVLSQLTAGQPSAFDATVQREQNEQISAGMQHIAAEYRESLLLRFQEGMSLEEIATVTGAPLGTVKSRIYRGLTALEPWVKGARL